MKYLIACLILLGTNTMSAQERPEIIYVFDPLCGWCYGFSPVIKQAYDTYKDKADFKVITGGMIIGDQISPIGKMAEPVRNLVHSSWTPFSRKEHSF
jgi:putative protein-disulfide isomerase